MVQHRHGDPGCRDAGGVPEEKNSSGRDSNTIAFRRDTGCERHHTPRLGALSPVDPDQLDDRISGDQERDGG